VSKSTLAGERRNRGKKYHRKCFRRDVLETQLSGGGGAAGKKREKDPMEGLVFRRSKSRGNTGRGDPHAERNTKLFLTGQAKKGFGEANAPGI